MATASAGVATLRPQDLLGGAFQEPCRYLPVHPPRSNQRRDGGMHLANGQLVFFFPQPVVRLGKEQVADRAEDQVAFESRIASPLIMVQTDFAFAILETPFH